MYHEVNLFERVAMAWTDGAGFDHIVDVGGGITLEQSLQAVGSGGNIHVIGVLSGVKAELVLTRLLMHQVRLQGVFVGSRETFLALNDLVTAKRLRPLVDQCFPLASIREAFEYLAGGHHMGKVVIQLDEGSS